MDPTQSEHQALFSTPWFEVFARLLPGQSAPHYVIRSVDFVVIIALDCRGRLLLVRQMRPAVEAVTLELPAGHIDPGETPEQAARKELLEETGYEAASFELLARLSPSTARFTNRMWCFFAEGARPALDGQAQREAGMELALHEGSLGALLAKPDFFSAPSCAALFAGLAAGKLRL